MRAAPGLIGRHATFFDILAARAQISADAEACAFISAEGQRVALSYGALLRRAAAIGAALQQAGAPGDRVLLVYPPGLEFIAALCGCWAAGMVAVPAQPPGGAKGRARARLAAIARDAQPRQILSVEKLAATLMSDALRSCALEQLSRLITTDALGERVQCATACGTLAPSDIALLQYTSGTTAAPKGVMLTHANLLHNAGVIYDAFGHSARSRGVIWLPPYHDMGLIGGVLQPLYAGFPVTLMTPSYFVQQPARWLQAISGQRAVTSGGPNFAYELCVRAIGAAERARLDLSGWEVAFNGSEPIDAGVLERFAQAFAASGFRPEAFYPCYGLAEATLMVSGGPRGGKPRHAPPSRAGAGGRAVSCGPLQGEAALAIVEPATGRRCGEQQVGEIWLASPSVAAGYWQQPLETERTFGARLGDTREGPFLRTGDLGFVRDGELYVTGRLKDLIIIRGVNHYPAELESTVSSCDAAIRPASTAAFSILEHGEERLVIALEIERGWREQQLAHLVGVIQRAIYETHELEVHAIALLRAGQLARTSSGKLQRLEIRAAFIAGRLEAAHQWRSMSAVPAAMAPPELGTLTGEQTRLQLPAVVLERWIAARLAASLGISVESIEPGEPFARYGLDSVKAVALAKEIEQRVGGEVSPMLFWDYPSVADLARKLADVQPQGAADGAVR